MDASTLTRLKCALTATPESGKIIQDIFQARRLVR